MYFCLSKYAKKTDAMNKPKKIPYALTNFDCIRTENYLYVDKTRFIEMLENEATQYHFSLRIPQQMLSTLSNGNFLRGQ